MIHVQLNPLSKEPFGNALHNIVQIKVVSTIAHFFLEVKLARNSENIVRSGRKYNIIQIEIKKGVNVYFLPKSI